MKGFALGLALKQRQNSSTVIIYCNEQVIVVVREQADIPMIPKL